MFSDENYVLIMLIVFIAVVVAYHGYVCYEVGKEAVYRSAQLTISATKGNIEELVQTPAQEESVSNATNMSWIMVWLGADPEKWEDIDASEYDDIFNMVNRSNNLCIVFENCSWYCYGH